MEVLLSLICSAFCTKLKNDMQSSPQTRTGELIHSASLESSMTDQSNPIHRQNTNTATYSLGASAIPNQTLPVQGLYYDTSKFQESRGYAFESALPLARLENVQSVLVEGNNSLFENFSNAAVPFISNHHNFEPKYLLNTMRAPIVYQNPTLLPYPWQINTVYFQHPGNAVNLSQYPSYPELPYIRQVQNSVEFSLVYNPRETHPNRNRLSNMVGQAHTPDLRHFSVNTHSMPQFLPPPRINSQLNRHSVFPANLQEKKIGNSNELLTNRALKLDDRSNFDFNLLRAVLYCLFSVDKFEKFIWHNQFKVPKFEEFFNLHSIHESHIWLFNKKGESFLQNLTLNVLNGNGLNTKPCSLLNGILWHLHAAYSTSSIFNPKCLIPFQIGFSKIVNCGNNVPSGEIQLMNCFIFDKCSLLNKKYIFPENFSQVDSFDETHENQQDLSKEAYSVYKCDGAIILRILGSKGKFFNDKPGIPYAKITIFSQTNLKNGILHPKLGRLVIRSALIYYSTTSFSGYCSLVREKIGWFLFCNGEFTKVNIDDILHSSDSILLFVFFEVENKQ